MDNELEQKGEGVQYIRLGYTELNPMTRLYDSRIFLRRSDELLSKEDKSNYVMLAMDFVHFRLYNKIYGRQEGDKVLVNTAKILKDIQDKYAGVAGYFGADNFCVVVPDDENIFKEIEEAVKGCFEVNNRAVCFYPVFGVCAKEGDVSAAVMYDHATIALSKAIGTFRNRICRYDSSMEEKLEEELELLVEIQDALDRDEFTFFAQPQCDISTGKIVGAESLVRWIHGEKGMISPGVFIPALEKNGLISELDRHVWKKVCQWLRSWIDRGYHPVPISVNVSRMDIFAMDVPKYLKELLEEFNLPARLLKVEITEGAYAEHAVDINKTVKELRDLGFLVMMDDFGSGYSSLNMLKDVAVDVLKLDMRFLDIGESEEDKGISIIESVVNMARVMGLPIIVEGVENQKQEKYLMRMGCRYTQGYYYYKPLPIDKFEELLSDERKLDFEGLKCRQVEAVRMRELLDDNMFNDSMLNNMLGATAFYDVYDNWIEITRVNEQYYQLTGISGNASDVQDRRIGSHVRDDDKQRLLAMFAEAYQNPEEGATGHVHFMRTDGEVLWVYMRVFFLNEKDGHRMYYGSLVDMTEEHAHQDKCSIMVEDAGEFEEQLEDMHKFYGEMPYGYSVGRLVLDDENDPIDYEIVYANHQMENMSGGSMTMLRSLIARVFEKNPSELLAKAYAAAYMDEVAEYFFYSDVTNRYIQLTFHQYKYGYAGCIMRDVTHLHIYEEALNGIMSSYREVYHLNIQDNYLRMIYPDESDMLERGDYEEAVNRHFGMGKILPYNEKNIRKILSLGNIREELRTKDSIELRYRRSSAESPDEWCLTTIKVTERENGVPKTAVILVMSIENLLKEEEEKRRQNMAGTLASMSEGFFIYKANGDEEILYANPKVLEIYGCKTMEEFTKLVNNSFKGMVHPGDLARIEWEIHDQVKNSEGQMDYIRYRIKRKDGEIRWLDDCGHLVSADNKEDELFYVFISDITDEITIQQQDKLLNQNKFY